MKFARKIIPLAVTAIYISTAATFCSKRILAQEAPSSPSLASREHEPPNQPESMIWIAGGEFTMGTNDVRSFPNERPAHRVHVEGFWIDEHDVTNAEFAKFVEAKGYVTTAERKPDWEELKKELPPGTPKPDESVLVALEQTILEVDRSTSATDWQECRELWDEIRRLRANGCRQYRNWRAKLSSRRFSSSWPAALKILANVLQRSPGP